MNNKQEQIYYLVLPFDILGAKDINTQEKLVLARVAGFREFFESSQATADFLGISKLAVERAKRTLAKLGYIKEIADTGRGKVYRAASHFAILDHLNGGRYDKKVRPDITKKSDRE